MKRIVSFLLATVMLVTTLASCSMQNFSFGGGEASETTIGTSNANDGDGGSSGDDNTQDESYISRIEWIEMLGMYFGMDSCMSADPYFVDVSSSNPRFAYLQSCVEWEIVPTGEEKFQPDEYATVDFVVRSAVIASETTQGTDKDPLEYATECGIIDGDVSSYATFGYALRVVEWACSEYKNREFVEYENIKMNEAVKTMPEIVCAEDGVLTIPESSGVINVGDVIITAPTEEAPDGVARKVSSVVTDENGNYIVETVQPEIGDIYEEVQFACVGTVEDTSTIRTEEGVTVSEVAPMSAVGSDSSQLATMAYIIDEDPSIMPMSNKGKDLVFTLNLSSGKGLQFSGVYTNLETEEEKELFNKTGVVVPKETTESDNQEVTPSNKYSSGWEIEGSIGLRNFYVETEVDLSKNWIGIPNGIKKFECEVHYEVESYLRFAGKFDREFKLATIPIPIGWGFSIDVDIFAKISASGDLEISAKLTNTTNIEYTKNNGIKKTEDSDCEKSAELNINFRAGVGAKVYLKFLGWSLLDVKLEIGLGLDVNAKWRRVMSSGDALYEYNKEVADAEGFEEEMLLCIDAQLFFPTVALSIGNEKNLASDLGLKFKWNIMDKSGASLQSFIIPFHYEVGKGFLEQCSVGVYEVPVEETTAEEEQGASRNEIMDISQYAVILAPGNEMTLSVTALPYGYTGNDIKWVSSENSIVEVASVNAGEDSSECLIKANGTGVTTIFAMTSDGRYQLKCAVTVRSDNEVDFTPIE